MHARILIAWAASFALLVSGCGDDDVAPMPDTGVRDGGTDAPITPDGGQDAGTPDGGPADTGPVDAGPCESAAACPPAASECEVPFCGGGVCMTLPAAEGMPLATQTPGDCTRRECDGSGGIRDVA